MKRALCLALIAARAALAAPPAADLIDLPRLPAEALRPAEGSRSAVVTGPAAPAAAPDSAEAPKAAAVPVPAPAVSMPVPSVPAAALEGGAGAVSSLRLNARPVIRMRPGENVCIPVAAGHANRLLTPFASPQVVSTTLEAGKDGACGEVCVRGSVVYVSTEKPYPVTAFIMEEGREDVALSVTMVPRRIPPREVRLELPREAPLRPAQPAQAQGWERSAPYAQVLREAFRALAAGRLPEGYGLRQAAAGDRLPSCRQSGLAVRFSGGMRDALMLSRSRAE
ncbi:MAG: type-F conjugative transfer system secretin TraK, partial [Duodenibacillus sp.]|nr:type-F conjugative transfer system secretin TraK [Duodenibacillus sp.]